MLTKCVDKTDILESWQFIEPVTDFDFQAKKSIDDFSMNSSISITQNSGKNWIAYLPNEHIDDTVPIQLHNKDFLVHHRGLADWWIVSYDKYVSTYQELN